MELTVTSRYSGSLSRKHYTLAEARAILASLGLTLRKEDREYRVNFRGGREGTAHYTDAIDDAVDAGRAMVKEAQRR